jgi:hypothetical protein
MAPPQTRALVAVATNTGVVTDYSQLQASGRIKLRIKEKTKLKVLRLIEAALEENSLAPNAAGSLYGKIRWVLSLGPVGRAATQPIKALQYEDKEGPWKLTQDVHAALAFLRNLLDGNELPDSVLHCSPSAVRPIIVFSDASYRPVKGQRVGQGRVAFVVAFPKAHRDSYEFFFAWKRVPESVLLRLLDLRDQRNLICSLEEIALVAPYISEELSHRFRDADVLHFADNTAANAAAIKGYSAAPDLAHLVARLHLTLSRGRTRFWLEFIRSRANLADAPSGEDGDLTLLESLRARRVTFTIPSLRGWSVDDAAT